MSSPKCSPEFKTDAVKQVVDRGYQVRNVAELAWDSVRAVQLCP